MGKYVALALAVLLCACTSKSKPKVDLSNVDPSEMLTRTDSFYLPPQNLYYFHHIDELAFRLDWIRRSGPVYPLTEAARSFSADYTYQGQTYSLEEYCQRNSVLGFLVLQDNRIVAERYFHGSNRKSKFLSYSVQKSMTSTLIGIALEEGKIDSLEDPVTKYLPGLSDSGYNRVTLKQVLEMATAVEIADEFDNPNSIFHKFIAVALTGEPSYYDFLKLIKEKPNVEPGTVFDYSTINTIVLGLVIEKVTGMRLNEYMQEKLWSKLGAESDAYIFRAKKQRDQSAFGWFCGTLRDYARFGLMMMNGGSLGAQIVGQSWVNEATTPQHYPVKPPASGGYGYQWWTSANNDGSFHASGLFGQLIYINPAKRIVIVQMSAWPEPSPIHRWDEVKAVLHAIASKISK